MKRANADSFKHIQIPLLDKNCEINSSFFVTSLVAFVTFVFAFPASAKIDVVP